MLMIKPTHMQVTFITLKRATSDIDRVQNGNAQSLLQEAEGRVDYKGA